MFAPIGKELEAEPQGCVPAQSARNEHLDLGVQKVLSLEENLPLQILVPGLPPWNVNSEALPRINNFSCGLFAQTCNLRQSLRVSIAAQSSGTRRKRYQIYRTD